MLVGSLTVNVDRLCEKAHVLNLASDYLHVIFDTLLLCIKLGGILFRMRRRAHHAPLH